MNRTNQFHNYPGLWTTGELANYLGCTSRAISKMRVRGMPFIHVGSLVRFDPQQVRTWLEQQGHSKKSDLHIADASEPPKNG